MLTTENESDFAANTTEVLSFSVYQQPLLVCGFLVAGDGFVT
jgi:hypothetical protein